MIDPKKTYKTLDGREVRIYATDGDEEMPVHGAILTKDGWKVTSWTRDGLWAVGLRDANDLVEVKPRIKRRMWLNVYPGYAHTFQCKHGAEVGKHPARIACVEIDIDVEEGHGL